MLAWIQDLQGKGVSWERKLPGLFERSRRTRCWMKKSNPSLMPKGNHLSNPHGEVSLRSQNTKAYWAQLARLEFREGVLCWKCESEDEKSFCYQTIVPRSLKNVILREIHSSVASGHLGIIKTTDRIKQKYYWAGQSSDIKQWCKNCTVCGSRNMPPRHGALLQQLAVSTPVERIAIDLVGPMPETDRGNRAMVVIVDYFTKWAESFCTF